MGFDYAGLRAEVAEPLIADFGKPGTLVINDLLSGEPYGSQLGSETYYPVTVVQTQFTKDNNSGTLVEKDDVLFLVSTDGVVIDPELADRMTVDGITYQVVRVDPLRPGPIIMLWKVHARK